MCRAGAVDKLVIAAPDHVLSDICAALAPEAVAETLVRSLVKTQDHELWPHVRDWGADGSSSGLMQGQQSAVDPNQCAGDAAGPHFNQTPYPRVTKR